MYTPDIFQENMSSLMEGLELARIYLDNSLCLSKDHFYEHLKDVGKSLKGYEKQIYVYMLQSQVLEWPKFIV